MLPPAPAAVDGWPPPIARPPLADPPLPMPLAPLEATLGGGWSAEESPLAGDEQALGSASKLSSKPVMSGSKRPGVWIEDMRSLEYSDTVILRLGQLSNCEQPRLEPHAANWLSVVSRFAPSFARQRATDGWAQNTYLPN